MFVAYTGYGRIATMGEEIEDPRRKIPRAMIATLVVSMVLYVSVAVVGLSAAGAEGFAIGATGVPAPLERAAGQFGGPGLARLVAVGAVLAMLGVLLNLVLGLSRVALAMGRRGDLPRVLSKLDSRGESPTAAVVAVGVLIVVMTTLGDVRTTWSFSAFAVLIYYSLTNLAALRLSKEERLYPAWISAVGLVACGFLAFWVDPNIWLTGLGVLAAGLLLRPLLRAVYSRS
jgi:APA family basic amino acid/polyamine antiporter